MVWCDEKKLLFVHIPKCGGSTVEHKLNLQNGKNGFRLIKNINSTKAMHHFSIEEYKNFFNETRYNNFNKLTIVRNPYSKFISEYYYFKRKKKGLLKDISLEDFLIYTEKLHENNFSNTEYNLYNDHFYTQSSFLYDNKSINIDNIFKLENFNEIKKYIDENYPNEKKWKHLDKNNIKKKIELSDVQKKRVYQLFKEDFINFNYPE